MEYEALSEDPTVPWRTYTWGVDLSRAAGAAALDGAAGIGGLVAICDPNDPNDPNDTAGAWAVLSDGNGNVVQLIDCTTATVNDAIACHYEYDPYGNRIEPDPNDPNAILDATENWLRFSTKYFDAETGLGYWGYRYYDPQTGRWLTEDPIGERGGVNLYGYVFNEPVFRWDGLGQKCGDCGGPATPPHPNESRHKVCGLRKSLSWSNPTASDHANDAIDATQQLMEWLDKIPGELKPPLGELPHTLESSKILQDAVNDLAGQAEHYTLFIKVCYKTCEKCGCLTWLIGQRYEWQPRSRYVPCKPPDEYSRMWSKSGAPALTLEDLVRCKKYALSNATREPQQVSP